MEKSELLTRRTEINSKSDLAKTDDQVDSAIGEEEIDRNDYESTSDMAYLDAYLDEYNRNRSLPRPPGNDRPGSIPPRISRMAHNDGYKDRSYDYNSNENNSYITFS